MYYHMAETNFYYNTQHDVIFAFWVTYKCISLIEEVCYVLGDSCKHFIFNPTLGSKTGTTNGVKACGRLQWISAHQTRPCSRQWTRSCSCPQCSSLCTHSCSRPHCSCPCSHLCSRPCSRPQCNCLCSLPLRFTSPLQFCDSMVAVCCSDEWLHV